MSSIYNEHPLCLLSISANGQDHSSLADVFGDSGWEILAVSDLAAASVELKRRTISVVVCDRDSLTEDWTEVLERIQAMSPAASVIITSRLADDRFWSQALHFGAWDVLAKPFRAAEVVRTVRYAWEHWRHQPMVRPTQEPVGCAG